jgi:hypothetical protein
MPQHPEWEANDSSGHQQALQLFADHLEAQLGPINLPIPLPVSLQANAAQRMTDLADKIRSGLLGVPNALRDA